MCELTLYRDCDPGSITVSNSFIDSFLADANDCQIKVYLYLIRMLSAKKPTNISDIADKFNHTEKDVCRALRYWEKMGVLSLDYDGNGGIVGIRLHELARNNTRPTSVTESRSVFEPGLRTSDPAETAPVLKRPDYSLEALREFKDRPDTPQLIFVAEQYLKRTLSANDIRSIMFYNEELGFNEDLIDYLLQFCISLGKKGFAYIDKVAIDWAERGIKTVKDAKNYTCSYDNERSTSSGKQTTRTGNARKKQNTTTMFHQFEQNDYDFSKLERKLLQQ